MKLIPYFLRTTYWIKDYIKGSPIRSHYNDIQTIMENSGLGTERRKQYLTDLLKHATQYSAFYNQYKYTAIEAFPVVSKSVLIENYDQIKIASNKIPNQVGPVFIQTTSGSTGTPLSVPQDTRKRNRRVAELKYFGERVGFKSHDKLVHLRTWNRWQKKTPLQSLQENILPFNITRINHQKLEDLCSLIKKNNVVALRGYASSIDLLARFVVENDIKLPSLKLMIAGSESLQDSTRELVNRYIGCHIISQYANEENGILAQEEISKGLGSPFYLNHASYFFEILKLDEDTPAEYGELGRVVITDLFNYAFPMIRYDTGDTGIMIKKAEHSNGYPVISKLFGRRLDLVFDTKGNVVYPMAIARILKHYTRIIQWQFIQNSERTYLLKLIVKNENFNSEEIRKELLILFGDNANIDFQFINEIPVLASGKRKPVTNNWKV